MKSVKAQVREQVRGPAWAAEKQIGPVREGAWKRVWEQVEWPVGWQVAQVKQHVVQEAQRR